MINLGRKVNECRMCGSKELHPFLDLGFMPPADGILSKEEIEEPETLFPLKVAQCLECGLTQLTYAANPKILYDEKYRYESSITEMGKKHFFEMADAICKKFNLEKDSLVVDIGSNVGVLLEGFQNNGMKVLGIDPAPKIAKIANTKGIETWQFFINPEIANEVVLKKGKASIISCTNVFAHIDDKKSLMESIKILLDDKGILVIEAPYFVDLIQKMEYDTIYIDHLEYLSIKPLISFFDKHNMEIFDVEKYEMHGGTMRYFVGKKGVRKISKEVDRLLNLEEEIGIYKKEKLDEFSIAVKKHKNEFVNLLREIKKENKKIVGISAPAKGNTLLNYCKIDGETVSYMTEKSTIKRNHFTPGMHIPILGEEKLIEDRPDYGVIFAWNFAKEIMKNNEDFISRGGKFIIPIPSPKIIGKDFLESKTFPEEIKPVYVDERGSIKDLLNKKINHVGIITSEKETVRGNHYHQKSTQYNYLLSGEIEVYMAPAEDPKNVRKVTLKKGELITIPPRTIHAFKALERSMFIDMISESREGEGYEKDVFRIKII